MMHSGDEDDEFCSVDWFGSIETNFLQKKKHKNYQKKNSKSSGTFRRDKIELIRLSSIRNSLKNLGVSLFIDLTISKTY